MPRETLIEGAPVDRLSILDEQGVCDEDLAPKFAQELLLKGYRTMLLARRFDERRLKLQRTGRIGTFAPGNGQEAAQVGTIAALRPQDWFVPSYRETAARIWRGVNLADLLVFDAGYNEGGAIPAAARDLPNAVPVATQLLHAAGIAYAARLQGTDEVAMTYFGDGATSQGDFHEALNFARVLDCPVVFVCQNNQYAISTPRVRQTKSETLAQKAMAYGVPGIQVDGNDLFACYVAAKEAVERARTQARPTLIECVTYRLEVHTTADDPTRYRSEEEVETWRKRDPLLRFERYLRNAGHLDDASRDRLEQEIDEEIGRAWTEATARIEGFDVAEPIFDHIFAALTPELLRQRARLVAGKSPGALVPGGGGDD